MGSLSVGTERLLSPAAPGTQRTSQQLPLFACWGDTHSRKGPQVDASATVSCVVLRGQTYGWGVPSGRILLVLGCLDGKVQLDTRVREQGRSPNSARYLQEGS